MVEASARLLSLELPAAAVVGVEANLALLAQLARMLDEAPLDDTADEPATTFMPR